MVDSHDMRRNYAREALNEIEVGDSPIPFFARWFEEAKASGEIEANAMILGTVGANGRPHGRAVLLKELREDDGSFLFYTNTESAKGHEIDANPNVSLVFMWLILERQVRVEGRAVRVSDADADAYFAQRPRQSQLGAWASAQSTVVEDREHLEERFAACERQFEGQPVPRPGYWSGYAVEPTLIEFWQGRPGRMHDRLCFERSDVQSPWTMVRRMP